MELKIAWLMVEFVRMINAVIWNFGFNRWDPQFNQIKGCISKYATSDSKESDRRILRRNKME